MSPDHILYGVQRRGFQKHFAENFLNLNTQVEQMGHYKEAPSFQRMGLTHSIHLGAPLPAGSDWGRSLRWAHPLSLRGRLSVTSVFPLGG